MESQESIKKLSKFLSSSLKDKNVKQSELLELLSQFHGYKDWNSLAGSISKNEYDKNNSDWSTLEYVHIDNGGYMLSYNEKLQRLYIETSFFGYSSNSHYFSMTKKNLNKLSFSLNKYLELEKDEDEDVNLLSNCFYGEGWKLKNHSLTFENDQNKIELSILTDKLLNIFKKML